MMQQPNPVEPTLETTPTTELVSQAIAEARELVELEVRLAKEELRAELMQAKRAAIVGGLALALGMLAASALLVALILALGGTAVAALVVGAVLVAAAAAGAAYAYAAIPKAPLGNTRRRVQNEINQLKEHTV